MTAEGEQSLRRKTLPWLLFVLMQLAAARAFAASADRIAGAAIPEPACVDMQLVVAPNVLAAMTTPELEHLQASLCPTAP